MKFSERHGYKTARESLQIESISLELRNSLWSLLKLHIWDRVYFNRYSGGSFLALDNIEIKKLCEDLWFSFFKKPLDTLSNDWARVLPLLRKSFFECEWWGVYDFVEFVANNFPYAGRKAFIEACNAALEREASAYRLVNGQIARITDPVEIDEVDTALAKGKGSVRTHLHRALELLSDRQSPDYRNSIKESISAVESLVANVVGEKGTLGQLLKKLEDEIDVHPALCKGFGNLYGYTSDEGGIRHALMEAQTVGFYDAKFFLVACSAFINFVESRVAGI